MDRITIRTGGTLNLRNYENAKAEVEVSAVLTPGQDAAAAEAGLREHAKAVLVRAYVDASEAVTLARAERQARQEEHERRMAEEYRRKREQRERERAEAKARGEVLLEDDDRAMAETG